MEIPNSKKQQLTFDKGITNVPSDAICSDNALSESVGMVYDNGEHRVIQRPREAMTSVTITLLFVHKVAGQDNYIGYDPDTKKVRWGTKDASNVFTEGDYYDDGDCLYQYTGDDVPQVNAVGNTLILNTEEGFMYFRFKEAEVETLLYKPLGTLPSLDMEFYLQGGAHVEIRGNYDGIADIYQSTVWNFAPAKQEAYNDLLLGMYAKNKVQIAEKSGFCLPFFVIAAIEMYDGTMTRITNPVLLVPSRSQNSVLWYYTNDRLLKMYTYYSTINYRLKTDLTEFSDIVKGINVYVTKGVEIYDLTTDQERRTSSLEKYIDGIFYYGPSHTMPGVNTETPEDTAYKEITFTDGGNAVYFGQPLVSRATGLVNDELSDNSVLYKIFSPKLTILNTLTAVNGLTEKLKALTSQGQLGVVDYFGNTTQKADNMMVYNSRLLLSNVRRTFFEGFHFFTPYGNGSTDGETYSFYVTIETPEGNRVVKHTVNNCKMAQGEYFFYPDTRARSVAIYKNGYLITERTLEEANGYGGAWIRPTVFLTPASDPYPQPSKPEPPTYDYPEMERLPNMIMMSEVNNPFTFVASGYYTVGTGDIVGMSTLTQALSQGQFGQYPLIVFTTEGIWAMSVADTGYFSAAHPMSREACNNPKSITQTDGAIFFSSAKGLMMIVGSTVKCVSEQMAGKTDALAAALSPTSALGNFSEFLKNCFIAYDYRDSLLWIFNGSSTSCYVYSIKSGTFAKYSFTNAITNIVNYYPDFLLQDTSHKVYTLTGRYDINSAEEQANSYSATMLTRPMKLENGLALKKLIQMVHIKDMEGTLTIRLFASNTLKQDISHWVELNSLLGTPWKYYRILYSFTGLKATDRFAGTMLVTKEERTNKLR